MNTKENFIRFMHRLYDYEQVSHEFDSLPRDYGIDQKLYINEAHTLRHIFLNEGISMSEMAEIENKTQSALSQKIKKLQTKGLLYKERDSDNYKRFNLYLTEEGKKVCTYQETLDEIFFDNILTQMDDWKNVDYDQVIHLLDLIIQQKLDYIVELKSKK